MSPKLPHLLALFLTIVLMSCTTDDGNAITDENTNAFTFNGATYELTSAIVIDETTGDMDINFFNKTNSELTSNIDLDGISFVYFEVQSSSLQVATYTEIDDYDISINGSVVDSEFNPGTLLLSANDPQSDIYAQSGSVNVRNFTAFNIDLTFTFTRTDGQLISGAYNGNYLLRNSSD